MAQILCAILVNNGVLCLPIVLCFPAVYVVWNVYDVFFGPLSAFPGPKLRAFSLLPHLLARARGIPEQTAAKLHAKYGSVVRISPNELSFIGNAQVWSDIHGHKRLGQPMPYKDPRRYVLEQNGVPSTISADNINHCCHCKALSYACSAPAPKEQELILRQWVEKLLLKLLEQAEQGHTVDMVEWFNMTTFDIMGDLMFGENLHLLDNGSLSPRIRNIFAFTRIDTIISAITETSPFVGRFAHAVTTNLPRVRQQAMGHWNNSPEQIRRRMEKGDVQRRDSWTKALAQGDGLNDMTLGVHETNSATFIFAETQAIAMTVSRTLFFLLKNPKILARLQRELDHAFGSFDNVTLECLAQQKYLQACLQESLRLHLLAPVAVPRTIPWPGMTIDGHWVPSGVQVWVQPQATYRSASNFEHSDEFRPERWLDRSSFATDRLDCVENFSIGSQVCIGQTLAWHEMRLVLAAVLLSFEIKLNAKSAAWDQQRIFTIWEKKPLLCTLDLAWKHD